LRDAAALAWPASLAAIVAPLLGLIDTAVLARAAGPADIAGVALAGAVFSLLYWTLGGLRMSASGLAAQAHGAEDEAGVRAELVKAVGISAAIGLALLLLKHPIALLAEAAMTSGTEASGEAAAAMRTYVDIRLWGVPAVALSNACLGWLVGQGRLRLVMAVLVGIMGLNAGLDVWFVLYEGMGVRGIALGTLIAEVAGGGVLLAACVLVLRQRGGLRTSWVPARFAEDLRGVLSLNADLLLRTVILAFTFAWFVRAGGRFGDVTLAANQVLLQGVLVSTLVIDGAAVAAQTLVGQALGAREARRERFRAAVEATTKLAALIAGGLFLLLLLFGEAGLRAIVPPGEEAGTVFAEARGYLWWVIVAPLVLAPSFQLDGVFIGATKGRALRNGMIASAGVFAAGVRLLPPLMGNHGLWLAFALFMLARAATLLPAWPGLLGDAAPRRLQPDARSA
jgi:MATE family multidrug resistance protein